MTEEATAQAVSPAAHRSWNWWLAGRAGRREYWLYLALMIGLGLALRSAPPIVNIVMTLVLAFVQMRRIHDFGRTGWWALAATLAPFVALPLIAVTSEEIATLVALAVELAVVTWIGAIRGDAGENRFGPPPPFTWKRVLTGR